MINLILYDFQNTKNVPPVQKGRMKKRAFTQHLGGVEIGFCYLKMTIAGREYHQVRYLINLIC